MVEPVGTTLAAVGLFLHVFDLCDRLYHGHKLTRRFGADFELTRIEIEVQWVRLHKLVSRRRILHSEVDREASNFDTIYRLLFSMKMHFEACNKLMGWYSKFDNQGPYQPKPLASAVPEESSSDMTLLSQTSSATQSDSGSHSPTGRGKVSPDGNFLKRAMFTLHLKKGPRKVTNVAPTDEEVSTQVELSGPVMDTAEIEFTYDSQRFAKDVTYFKKMAWARRDLNSLKETIRNIRHGNNDLEALVKHISLEKSSRMFQSSTHDQNLRPMLDHTKQIISQLHQDLVTANSDVRNRLDLSLQLLEDHSASTRDLENNLVGSSLQLPRGAAHDVFIVQTLKKPQRAPGVGGEDYSTMLIIDHTAVLEAEMEQLLNLKRPLEATIFADDETERWGCLYSSDQQRFNVIYHEQEEGWMSTGTLQSLLIKGAYQDIAPVQALRLARVVLCTQLQMDGVLNKTRSPRPEHYQYFEEVGSLEATYESGHPACKPWLSIGFGSRQPKIKLGGRSGTSQSKTPTMLELGLFLYQIGSWESLDYSTGLDKCRDAARRNQHKVHQRLGLPFKELVDSFFEFETKPPLLITGEDEAKEEQHVLKAIGQLHVLERDLENTVSIPDPEVAASRGILEMVEDLSEVNIEPEADLELETDITSETRAGELPAAAAPVELPVSTGAGVLEA